MPANIVEIIFKGRDQLSSTTRGIDQSLGTVTRSAGIAAAAVASIGTGATLAGAHVERGVMEIATLMDGDQEAGIHTLEWAGTDRYGRPVPSGVYLYRIETASYSRSRRMLVIR